MRLWTLARITREDYAPTPITSSAVPPGAPTVLRAGPSFPAELTNTTPWSFTCGQTYHSSGLEQETAYKITSKLNKAAFIWMFCWFSIAHANVVPEPETSHDRKPMQDATAAPLEAAAPVAQENVADVGMYL